MVFEAKYDVIILGGGPAGMSAALWCADLDLKAILVERETDLGGQLCRIFAPIKNYLGVVCENGKEMRDRFLDSLSKGKTDLKLGEELRSIDLTNKRIKFANGDEAQAAALIIATGVRRRKLGVEGEEQFVGRGILTSGVKEKESVKNSNVAIVGGGDAALENALILSDHASQVTLIHRRNEFSARLEFVGELSERSNVDIKFSSRVKRFLGDDELTSVEIEHGDGTLSTVDATFALVRIGVEPNSEYFQNELKMDSRGYIEISPNCETSREGIYAIGDVAFPISPTIATAVGSAATACKHLMSKYERINVSSKD